jgi:hypothetical protein
MAGFLASLKESILGKAVNLPICTLSRRKPLHVFYKYYQDKPRSHRLEFRKGKRPTFEMSLPCYGENIEQLCAAAEGQENRKSEGETVFGFWQRVILRFSLGQLISCRDIFDRPSSELHTPFGDAFSHYRYRLAYGRKGVLESIVLVSSRHSRQSGTYRKEQKHDFNWLKLSLGELEQLVAHLRSFTGGKEFAAVMEQEVAE